jgi:hypothetical protein
VAGGSREAAAVPELLKVLDLEGAVVTLDAAGCQKAIAQQIRGQGGDYLLAVEGNQPALQRAAHAAFAAAGESEFAGCDTSESVEDGHGPHEGRYGAAQHGGRTRKRRHGASSIRSNSAGDRSARPPATRRQDMRMR